MKKSYVLFGEPNAQHFRAENRSHYDSLHAIKINLIKTLEQQHEENPLFEGPLCMDIIFYMKMSKSNKQGNWHTNKPNLRDLTQFYRTMLKDTLFVHDCIIAKESCMKVYDTSPRTIITIEEM